MDPLDPRGPNIGGPDPLNPPVDAPMPSGLRPLRYVALTESQ